MWFRYISRWHHVFKGCLRQTSSCHSFRALPACHHRELPTLYQWVMREILHHKSVQAPLSFTVVNYSSFVLAAPALRRGFGLGSGEVVAGSEILMKVLYGQSRIVWDCRLLDWHDYFESASSLSCPSRLLIGLLARAFCVLYRSGQPSCVRAWSSSLSSYWLLWSSPRLAAWACQHQWCRKIANQLLRTLKDCFLSRDQKTRFSFHLSPENLQGRRHFSPWLTSAYNA